MTNNIICIIFLLISSSVFSQDKSIEEILDVEIIKPKKSEITMQNYSIEDTLFSGIEFINCECIDTLNMSDSCHYKLTYFLGNLIKQEGFYESGEKMIEYFFNNGQKVKTYSQWYRGNKRKMSLDYSTQHAFPPGKEWYKNGQLKNENIYFEDYGIFKEWHENGQIKTEADMNFDGSSLSYEKKWTNDGLMKCNLKLNQGKQPFIYYFDNGNIATKGTNIDFSLFWVGKKTEWHPNGTKMIEKYFQDGETRQEANIKTGKWKYWNEKGEITKIEKYDNNKLIDTKEYSNK